MKHVDWAACEKVMLADRPEANRISSEEFIRLYVGNWNQPPKEEKPKPPKIVRRPTFGLDASNHYE